MRRQGAVIIDIPSLYCFLTHAMMSVAPIYQKKEKKRTEKRIAKEGEALFNHAYSDISLFQYNLKQG